MEPSCRWQPTLATACSGPFAHPRASRTDRSTSAMAFPPTRRPLPPPLAAEPFCWKWRRFRGPPAMTSTSGRHARAPWRFTPSATRAPISWGRTLTSRTGAGPSRLPPWAQTPTRSLNTCSRCGTPTVCAYPFVVFVCHTFHHHHPPWLTRTQPHTGTQPTGWTCPQRCRTAGRL